MGVSSRSIGLRIKLLPLAAGAVIHEKKDRLCTCLSRYSNRILVASVPNTGKLAITIAGRYSSGSRRQIICNNFGNAGIAISEARSFSTPSLQYSRSHIAIAACSIPGKLAFLGLPIAELIACFRSSTASPKSGNTRSINAASKSQMYRM